MHTEDLTVKKLELEIKNQKKKIEINNIKKAFMFILVFAEIIFIAAFFNSTFKISDKFIENSDTKVAIVKLNKQITGDYIEDLISRMNKLKKDKKIKEIILDISSPGGSPVASQEFSEYIKDFNKTKPITMYIDEMAASGAYYIASSIKPLYSNKNAIVGSIGVILPHYSAEGLSKKIGVEEDSITAGKFKKPLSFFKKPSEDDKKYLEKHLLEPAYNNFIADVAMNRNIKTEDLKRYAEGRVFIANMDEIKGVLVDKITNLFLLKKKMTEKYGEKTSFPVIDLTKEKKSLLDISLEIPGLSKILSNQAQGW